LSKPVDSKGNELKTGHIYREVNGQYVPFKTIGKIYTEKLASNEKTKYFNVGGVMIQVVVPKQSTEPREPPISMDPIVILQKLMQPRPYTEGDREPIVLVPSQLKFIKEHKLTGDEMDRLVRTFNFDEQRVLQTIDRLEQLRKQDAARVEQEKIALANSQSAKFFFENLPNKRKFSCGHIADRRNILDISSFKKDKEKGVVFCQHGDNGTLPLAELF